MYPNAGRGAGGTSGHNTVGGVFRGGKGFAGAVVVAAEGG